ncbi:MAG: hypothetical protein FJ029_03960 [Actinobacteria bacterium]|nr:hypothetical protein [Actinomycetota bacterium]
MTVPLPGAVVSLAFADPLIFAAAPGAGIQAVDIRSPTRRGWRTRSSARSMSSPLKADCCSDSASARRLRSARSIWPSWTHHREVDVPLGIGAATFGNVAIEGGLAVVAGGSAPMSVLDVSNPASIRLLARVPSVVNIAAVRLRNRRAYCSVAVAGDGRLGIAVFDLSDATRPAHLFTVRATRADGLSRARLPGHFDVRAEAVGSILFTAAHGSLSTISLLDLGAPSALATLHMTPDAVHLARWGERLVVAGGDVDLIDVATPAAPRPLARVATPGTAREALIARDHLYVADGEAGLSVYRL